MVQTIFDLVLLLLPAGVANSMPVIAAKYNWLPSLNRPLDGDKGILGGHKTVRGFIVGILFGSITGYILYLVGVYTDGFFATFFGGLLGLGALAGDSIKSFFKRRLRITPGKSWPPFDQIDYVLGALVVAVLFVPLTFQHIIFAIIFFGTLSLITSYVGKKLKIKKSL